METAWTAWSIILPPLPRPPGISVSQTLLVPFQNNSVLNKSTNSCEEHTETNWKKQRGAETQQLDDNETHTSLTTMTRTHTSSTTMKQNTPTPAWQQWNTPTPTWQQWNTPTPAWQHGKSTVLVYLLQRLLKPVFVSSLSESISNDTSAFMLPQRHHDATVSDHLTCGVEHAL